MSFFDKDKTTAVPNINPYSRYPPPSNTAVQSGGIGRGPGGIVSGPAGTTAYDPRVHIKQLERDLEVVHARVDALESLLTFTANIHPDVLEEYRVWLKTKNAMGVK